MPDIRLHESWKMLLRPEFEAEYMQALRDFLLPQKSGRRPVEGALPEASG